MKLSHEAKLCLVGVFQKGLLGLEAADKLLEKLDFIVQDSELVVTNPEICQITNEELEEFGLHLEREIVDA